jgi:hypothetical protein
MTETYNIYCDESCHLEHDQHKVMVLGAIWCPLDKTREIADRLRDIKERHGLRRDFEIKWTKVSKGKEAFYLDVLDYFLDDDDLRFRAVIVPDKSALRHAAFDQDHDTWYYKMLFDMLKVILRPDARYRIYLDLKDTLSEDKVRKLHEVLANNLYDFEKSIVERVQSVRSHEVEQLQLADLLIGAVGYANRELAGNRAKERLVQRMRQRSRYPLTRSTLVREEKVNIFIWRARERMGEGAE